jgi:uncharacterized delta-60 repeat protein
MAVRLIAAAVFAFISLGLAVPSAAAPGDLDLSYGVNGVALADGFGWFESCHDIARQKDGKIVMIGSGNPSWVGDDIVVLRLNANGSLDTTFNGTGKVATNIGHGEAGAMQLTDDSGESVMIQPNGRILVSGVTDYDKSCFVVVRYLPTGALDSTFGTRGVFKFVYPGGRMELEGGSAALQADGKIVVVGHKTNGSDSLDDAIVIIRVTATGALDKSFNGTGIRTIDINPEWERANDVAIQLDGRILVAGLSYGEVTDDLVMLRLNANGTPDQTFGAAGTVLESWEGNDGFTTHKLAFQEDGKIVVAALTELRRYRVDGSLDTSFNGTGSVTVEFSPLSPFSATGLAIQADGKIVVSGMDDYWSSAARAAMARILQNGAFDPTFSGDGKLILDLPGGDFETLLQPDGAILLGGTMPAPVLPDNSDFAAIQFLGDAPAPEIAVEQPVPTRLVDGSSTLTYGDMTVGANASKTFTIRNVGNAAMSGIAASLTVSDPGEFTLTTAPASTLPAFTGTTTVTVRFNPSIAGAKSAVLHITSDDPDEPSFDIDLSGNAVPLLSLGSSIIRVTEESQTVNIPIIRTGGNAGVVTVNLSTVNGTAVDTDFTGVRNQLVTLGDGVGSVDVPIAIDDRANTNETNETFKVELSSPSGAVLKAPSSATVVILDSVDEIRPQTTVITSPLAGAVLPVGSGGTVTIKGMAADNQRVKSVEVSLDGVNFVPATITPTGTAAAFGTTATFSVALTPASGRNTVVARTVDMRDNVSLNLASRTFKVTRKLVANVDPLRGSVTSGFAPSSWREVGRSYTIAAKPKSTGIFAGWSIAGIPPADHGLLGITNNSLQKPALTLIFREELELTAIFENNPYDDLGVAGTYNGLVNASPDQPDRVPTGAGDEDGTASGMGTEGCFTATVAVSGAFSGKLTLDGVVLPVAGAFDHQGRARFGPERTENLTIERTGKPSLVVNLNIGGPPGSAAPAGRITGGVSAMDLAGSSLPVSVSLVSADRAHYNGTAGLTVPDSYLTVSGAARADGIFTVVLPPVPLASQPVRIRNVLTEMDYPRGSGVGSIRVSKAGLVTLTATLADGTAVTASSTLSQELRAGLFARLYSSKGFLSAPIQFNNAEPDSDLKTSADGEVLWSRPFDSASHYYAYGWAETLELDLLGAKYAARTGESVVKAANGANLSDADEDGNVKLTFADGQLTEDLLKYANVSTTDSVIKVPDSDPTFSMTVNRATGVITGTFNHTDDTTPSYRATIIQKGPTAGARGYFLTKQPTPIDYTGESGKVEVIGAP